MVPGMCVAFRAVTATNASDLLDAQLALALEQQLTAAQPTQPTQPTQPNLSDQELVALLATRRELIGAQER